MTTATKVDTDITPPPAVGHKTMKSHRYDDETYAKALVFSKEDGGLQHVLNELLARYVSNKEAQHAAGKKNAAATLKARRAAKEKPTYDPFA